MTATPTAPALRDRIRGATLLPGDPGFAEATQLWNGAIRKSPAIVAQPTGAADVAAAVEYARDHGSSSRCAAAGTTSPARRSRTAG